MAFEPDLSLLGNSQPDWRFGTRLGNAAKGLLGNRDLALALLANSRGPNAGSFGQALGTSMIQADQMKQGREDDAFKRQYMQAQMAALQGRGQRKPIAVLDEHGKPVLVDEQDAIGKQPYAGGNDAKPSALIQAFNLAQTQGFKGSLLEFQTELAKASAQYPYSVNDIGGVPTLTPRISPNMPTQTQPAGMVPASLPVKPLSNLDTEAAAKGRLAEAGAAGSEKGQSTAKAEFDLPRVETNVSQAISDINALKTHPGLQYITGFSSKAPIVPGTVQADADARAKQIEGQTFLNAFNQLKGAGAITEQEGAQAKAAIGRLSRAQSKEAYQTALNDLTKVLNSGLEKARKQARQPSGKTEDPLGIR
jgi:hypothetical protein